MGRNRISCARLGQSGKRRYGMGLNGIERNWMGKDEMQQGGGEYCFPSISELMNKKRKGYVDKNYAVK